MKTAKHLLSFCFLFFASQYLYAQSNYKQGYVITNENDTLIGWIDYRTDRMNSKICRFKKDETNEITETYAPGQIAGYRFSKEGKFYVTRNIEIKGKPQTVFLEYLLQGIMNLYFLSDETTDRYYYIFEDTDGKMTYLTKRPDEMIAGDDGKYYQKTDRRYRNVLTYTFQDYEPIKKETEKLKFEHNSMIGLAKDYHKQVCTTGEDCIEFETKLDKNYMKVQYSISGGIERQVFNLEYLNLNFNHHFAPFIKAGIDLSVPRWMNSVSLSVSAYLTEIEHVYNGSVDVLLESYTSIYNGKIIERHRTYWSYWDYSFKAYQLGGEIAAKYTYSKGRVRPGCQIGLNLFNTPFEKKIYSYKETTYSQYNSVTSTQNNSVTSQTTENEITPSKSLFRSFNMGAGINFRVQKEQFLFLNVNYQMPINTHFTGGLNIKNIWQLELGYRF